MKRLLVIAIATTISATAFAQQKFGHLNSIEILQAMGEFKTMNDQLEKKKLEYTKVMENMYKEYEAKSKDLQDNGKNMMEAVLEAKISELQDLQRRIGAFEEKVQNDLTKLQDDLMKPINDKYVKAVQEVAKNNGYTYVFDVASGALPFFPEVEGDITALVKKKLESSAPATPSPAPAPKK